MRSSSPSHMPEHTMLRYIDTDALRARREAIDQEIARHRDAISALEQKRSELEIGERIIAEFGIDRPANGHADEATDFRPNPPDDQKRPKKPADLPTVPDMIFAALRDARARGAPGMHPRELVAFIRKTYWPEAPSEAVTPIAWRMWNRDGALEKDDNDSLYRLPTEKQGESDHRETPSFTFT